MTCPSFPPCETPELCSESPVWEGDRMRQAPADRGTRSLRICVRLRGPLLVLGLLAAGRGWAQAGPDTGDILLPDSPGFLQRAAGGQAQGTGSISGLLSDVNGGIV